MEIALDLRSKADNSTQRSNLPLTGRIVLGRGPDCAVLLDGQGISREHLAVEAENSTVFVTDMSSNGTWLNGKRLSQNDRSKVETGDLIEVPGYEMRFQTSAPMAPLVPPAARRDLPPRTEPVSCSTNSFTFVEKFAVLTALTSTTVLLLYLYL